MCQTDAKHFSKGRTRAAAVAGGNLGQQRPACCTYFAVHHHHICRVGCQPGCGVDAELLHHGQGRRLCGDSKGQQQAGSTWSTPMHAAGVDVWRLARGPGCVLLQVKFFRGCFVLLIHRFLELEPGGESPGGRHRGTAAGPRGAAGAPRCRSARSTGCRPWRGGCGRCAGSGRFPASGCGTALQANMDTAAALGSEEREGRHAHVCADFVQQL